MAKGPIEPHLLFALQICSAGQFQENQQLTRQIASFSGYGTIGTTTLTPGITQGANENSRMSYVPYNMGPSSSAALVPQSANMGTSLAGTDGFSENCAHIHVLRYVCLNLKFFCSHAVEL